MFDVRLSSKIFKKLRYRIDAGDEQVIAGSCASDVQKMPFSVVQVFKVGMITDCSDAILQRDDVVVTGNDANAAKLESLRGVHRRKAYPSETMSRDVGCLSDGIPRPSKLGLSPAEDGDLGRFDVLIDSGKQPLGNMVRLGVFIIRNVDCGRRAG